MSSGTKKPAPAPPLPRRRMTPEGHRMQPQPRRLLPPEARQAKGALLEAPHPQLHRVVVGCHPLAGRIECGASGFQTTVWARVAGTCCHSSRP